jgi:hypothetical protein
VIARGDPLVRTPTGLALITSLLTVLDRDTQIVEVVARGDVREIRTERKISAGTRALGLFSGIGGFFVGGIAGGLIAGAASRGKSVGLGLLVGMVGGAALGYRMVAGPKSDLIYRAPL